MKIKFRLMVNGQFIESDSPLPIPRVGEHLKTKSGTRRVKDVIHDLMPESGKESDAGFLNQNAPRIFLTEVILED